MEGGYACLISTFCFALAKIRKYECISVIGNFCLPKMLPGISIIKFVKISNKVSHKVGKKAARLLAIICYTLKFKGP